MSEEFDWDDIEWEDFIFENGVLYLEERREQRFRVFLNIWLSTSAYSYNAFSGNISVGEIGRAHV